MKYRKLTADRIFNGKELMENKALVTDTKGKVVDIISRDEAGIELEIFEGIICPGFINCHCHVELSHLKGFIPAGTGLVDFLISIVRNRASYEGDKEGAIALADQEMWENGISGVADICNTTDAVPVKLRSRIRWHNFLEVINFFDENLEKQIGWAESLMEEHRANGLQASLVPHAPYSVSEKTMRVINEKTAGQIISIHNQETAAEDDLFRTGGGNFLRLYSEFGNDNSPFPVTGKSSLQTWLPRFTNGQTLLLVHNTYISEEDIVFAKEHAARYGLTIAYCLCPRANLYIEDHLAPLDHFIKHDCTVVLGTDSYSSNWQLSLAHEMCILKKRFPSLTTEKLLLWGTSAGAEIMKWKDLGTFEKGKSPGVVLVDHQFSVAKRLI